MDVCRHNAPIKGSQEEHDAAVQRLEYMRHCQHRLRDDIQAIEDFNGFGSISHGPFLNKSEYVTWPAVMSSYLVVHTGPSIAHSWPGYVGCRRHLTLLQGSLKSQSFVYIQAGQSLLLARTSIALHLWQLAAPSAFTSISCLRQWSPLSTAAESAGT